MMTHGIIPQSFHTQIMHTYMHTYMPIIELQYCRKLSYIICIETDFDFHSISTFHFMNLIQNTSTKVLCKSAIITVLLFTACMRSYAHVCVWQYVSFNVVLSMTYKNMIIDLKKKMRWNEIQLHINLY